MRCYISPVKREYDIISGLMIMNHAPIKYLFENNLPIKWFIFDREYFCKNNIKF